MWNGIKFALTLAVLTVALAFSCPAEAQVVGQAIGTDIVAYINNYPIRSYAVNGYSAVLASDLASYGFSYRYDDAARTVFLNYTGATPSPLTFWRDQRSYGLPVGEIAETDITVCIDGITVNSVSINGMMAIFFRDLDRFGPVVYDNSLRAIFLTIPGMSMGTYAPVEERSTAVYDIRCNWTSGDRLWGCILKVPVALYDGCASLPRNVGYNYFVGEENNARYIRALADYFDDMARLYGLSAEEELNLVVDFVRSVRYVRDIDTKGVENFVNYPIETLFEWQGDCEDTAILLAGILKAMGRDVVLLVYPQEGVSHMAVGLKGDGSMTGTYYMYNGAPYYYVETTMTWPAIGEAPGLIGENQPIIVSF